MQNCSDSRLLSEQRGMRDVHSEIGAESRHASRNTREQEAALYLKQKGIRDIVDSLLGEILLRRPYDPYEYLIQLLDRRILTRDGLVDSPPPFSSRDIIRRAKQADIDTILELMTNVGQF